MQSFLSVARICLLLALPSVVLAAPRSFSELAGTLVGFLNYAVGTAIILGIVIYFYGISSGLLSLQKGESSDLRKRVLWGLLAVFVMVSVWGIVGLLRNSLFGGGASGGFGGGSDEGRCVDVDCL